MGRFAVNLREQARANGAQNALAAVREAVKTGRYRLRDEFSLREAAEAFCGQNWDANLRRVMGRHFGGEHFAGVRESAEAVDASNFVTISGQLMVDMVREKYELATQIGNQIFSVMPNPANNLTTHIEPWLGRVVGAPEIVNQGMPYPTTQFGPQYVTYPAPVKKGHICHLTFEMIYSDKTQQAFESADSVGEMTGVDEEEQKLATFLGFVNSHNWNGTAYNTYLTTGAWVNSSTTFALTDWTSVNTIEQLFGNMRDPVTGKPITLMERQCFVAPALLYTARRIFSATETRNVPSPGGTAVQTLAPNPIRGYGEPLTSYHARNIAVNGFGVVGKGGLASGSLTEARFDTLTVWGDFKKAFAWRQVYPMKVTQAPPQNPLEFNNDIVYSIKSSIFGVPVVKDPRYVVRAYTA